VSLCLLSTYSMMKLSLLVLVAAITCVYATSLGIEGEYQKKFIEFQKKYQKSYLSGEFGNRYQIFRSNLIRAAARQEQEKGTAKWGITKFSDLTDEEFKSFYLMPKFSAKDFPKHAVAELASPPQVQQVQFDWSQKGATTPIYNQGQCGSCWAFSATETIESYWFLAGHSLQQLSMQQIVDCDTTDDGCGGGWTYDAYQYVESAGGIESYNDYPYVAQDQSCQFQQSDVVATISGWQYVTQNQDEGQMYNWLASNGPLSVCVDASQWSSYQGGTLMASDCTTDLDHCVQLTGYGTDDSGTQFWNVRNSWGSDWGQSGYIWLQRGADTCGVAQVVTSVSI